MRGSGAANALLLQPGIQHDIGRTLGRGVGDPERAGHRFTGGSDAARLVVPFGVAAHDCTLVAGGVESSRSTAGA